MQELVHAFSQFMFALWSLIVAIGRPLLPWIPLAAWVVFWLFAVNWTRLREFTAKGGWLAVLLLAGAAVLIWGTVAPTPGGTREIYGLHVSNFVEKAVYVSALIVIANLAGSVQLSGALGSCCRPQEPIAEDEPHGHGHGSHGHDDHGHGDHAPALAAVGGHH